MNIQKRQAKFYDVSELVKIPEINNGFCKRSDVVSFNEDHTLLHQYIKINHLKIGDIIYIGNLKFVVVIDDIDHTFIDGNDSPYIIFQYYEYLSIIKNNNISYNELFNKMKEDTQIKYLFFGNNYHDVIEYYKEHDLI